MRTSMIVLTMRSRTVCMAVDYERAKVMTSNFNLHLWPAALVIEIIKIVNRLKSDGQKF